MIRGLVIAVALATLLLHHTVARADALASGRRKQNAGAALIVIGSTLIVGGAVLGCVGLLRGGADTTNQNVNFVWGGLGLNLPGIVGLGAGIPLYVSGTVDVDQARRSAGTAALATVRF